MTVPTPPVATVAPSLRPTETAIPLALGVGAVLLVAAIVNVVAGTGFPGNAPVEQVYSFGITVDLLVAGIILLVRGIRHRRRPRAAARATRPGILAIIAAVLAVVAVLGTLLLGGLDYLGQALSGERLRYMYASAGAFYLGAAWCLAFIFGVVGYRRGGGMLNAVLAIGALALAFLVLAAVLTAVVIYGLALSD